MVRREISVVFIVAASVLVFMHFGAERIDCAVYKHVDAAGRVHFSNVPVQSRYTFYCTEESDTSPGTASIDTLVQHYARRYALNPHLVKAVVRAESNFDPACVSSAGARGLMQIMPDTAAEMKIYDLFDPSQNIAAGSRYLSQMLERFSGNTDLALAAYNAGPTVVENYGGIPPYAETHMYLEKVNKFFNQYRRISEERE